MLLAILLAGLAESFGLVALLPFLSMVVGGDSGAAAASVGSSPAGRIVVGSLGFFGLEPQPGILLALIIFTVLVKCVLVLFSKKQVGYTVAHVATDLRLNLIRALLAARWEYYVRQPVGNLANAVATEAMRASQAYLCATTMIALLFQAVIYLLVALLVSWEITLVSLLVALLLLFLLNRLVKKSRRAGHRQTDLLQLLLAQLTDSLQSIKPLKAMAREELADTILVRQTTRLNKALRQQVYSKAALKALQEPMVTLVMIVGLYVALAFLHMQMAEVMVLIFLLAKFLQQLSKVQQQFQKMVIFESAYWSLLDKINEARQAGEIADGDRRPLLKESIHFQEVDFAYADTLILQRANLRFPVGTITALTGPSGAGKTTILDLVTRLCRPRAGKIMVDDVPLADIDLRLWRKMIGYVPQDPLLLNDSVALNVTFGDPEIREAEVVQALKDAGAWEFVTAMSDGLASGVGERGERLSGGQRQRLAIARALVQKPELLILDEATSALDQASAAAICETLAQLKGKLTMIVVSHQPALVAIADQAYRLEAGRVELLVDHS
jgi:ATP-binding cassette subfamily C protein